MNGTERTGRDGRLLALVIVVSLAVLLVLARFRFASDGAPPTPTGPLERIVARSTYEDMAATVANLVQRLSPSVVVLVATPIPPDAKSGAAGKKIGVEPVPVLPPRLVPAIRVGGRDLAVGHVPAGYQVTDGQGLRGRLRSSRSTPPEPSPSFARRRCSTRRAARPTRSPSSRGSATSPSSKAAAGGMTASPVFVGRADSADDAQWPTPVRVLGGTPAVPIGALVFALDGRFIGLATAAPDGVRLLIPASAIDATALMLASSGKGSRP